MNDKQPAADRSFPRQIKMTDSVHAAAVARAMSLRLTFSAYVRTLIAADIARGARRGK